MMNQDEEESLLTEIESKLKNKFGKEETFTRVQSTAQASASSERVTQLVLDDDERPRMPFTKDEYLIREDPALVAWEREVRKFLRRLSPSHGHRISAVMIYEWATGIRVADLVAEGGSANSELRKINRILRFYFGKSYATYIMNRKVTNAYRVKDGFYIKRRRPMTLELYAEKAEGTLNP